MIIDYKNDKEFALANGVKPENCTGETYFSNGKIVTGVKFRNFTRLCVENTVFENCSFEECKNISFKNCQIKNCVFKNDCAVEGIRTNFYDCVFVGCCSDGSLLSIYCNGQVKGCTFDSITALGDKGYVIYSVYGKKREVEEVVDCKFIDCQVENEDGDLCCCLYFKPFSSFNTIRVDNIDYESCDFELCGMVGSQEDI